MIEFWYPYPKGIKTKQNVSFVSFFLLTFWGFTVLNSEPSFPSINHASVAMAKKMARCQDTVELQCGAVYVVCGGIYVVCGAVYVVCGMVYVVCGVV